MNYNYDYGPNIDFRIRFVGTMKEYNGTYEDLDTKDKYFIQSICHMIYQIKEEIQSSDNGIFKLNGIWIHYLNTPNGEEYSVYTNDMMTVFHIIETEHHAFDIEFLSPNQCYKIGSLFDHVHKHQILNGRSK